MGVTGLWTVVAPTARPTQLATLNRKRLAVDASIWIYQFLKAVRDKEGNALRNSHVVGFFRRICKLLYYGIKPVFVFDGGAPILKRETVRTRARRREGRREDAARTAGKLLALQVARAAEEEDKRRKAERERTPLEEELPDDAELVYVDEIGMDQKERQAGRTFKRKDQYHLPDLDVSIENMGAPNDPRIMSQAELEDYAKQFHRGEDVNLYDFSKIDFEGPFFLSLPPGDRYNILNAARLRSRLRMGYSKEQLDGMFPDRMAFSRFQIERVKERNELTQRLMHLDSGGENFLDQGGRIAGEKGKEYMLVRNDGVEGGWALGVVSNRQGAKREDAIDLEKEEKSESEKEASDEDEGFEDVEIEGLNRIPKIWKNKHQRRELDYDTRYEDAVDQIARKRKAVYERRAQHAQELVATPVATASSAAKADETDDLFVQQDPTNDEDDDLFEDVNLEQPVNEEDDDELQRAITMSLQPHSSPKSEAGGFFVEDETEQFSRTRLDEEMDLEAALAESRKSKYESTSQIRDKSPPAQKSKFEGPLPFESLNLGQSLLGKKKAKKVEEDLSGGFDKDLGEDTFRKERPAHPIPSWFDAAPKTNDLIHRPANDGDDDFDDHVTYGREDVDRRETLRRNMTKEVIDVDAEPSTQEIINLDNSEDGILGSHTPEEAGVADVFEMESPSAGLPQVDEAEAAEREKQNRKRDERYRLGQQIADQNEEQEDVQMDAVAEEARASPPQPSTLSSHVHETSEFGNEPGPADTDDEMVEWSDSDVGAESPREAAMPLTPQDQPAGGPLQPASSAPEGSESDDEFEDVPSPSNTAQPALLRQETNFDVDNALTSQYLVAERDGEDGQNDGLRHDGPTSQENDQYLSDSDEELMRQLAIEVEEHARFTSSLTNKTPAEAARDYENELKQLRTQQKKDRRDADEVTHVMIQECQALLRLFGLPYITAPMEAEAQCAELVHLGLVDGIVTDDSDIFLFGGTRVYKNMFNAAKFVECYLAADLEKEYALDRRKLIRFAHLLGSDYTEGIPGVGPVSALEILTDFPTLEEFKEWCGRVQLGRPQDLEDQLSTPFRRKYKNTVQKRLFLPPGFPDLRVDNAYLKPEVDSDPQEFEWGVPDLDKLRAFLMATIGWSQERTDEVLVPVIRDMNKRELEGTQANITRFFAGGVGVGAADGGTAPRNRTGKESGRMANAFKRLRGEAERRRRGLDDDGEVAVANGDDAEAGTSEDVHVIEESASEPVKRGRAGKRRQPVRTPEVDGDDDDGEDESENRPKTASKKRRKRKAATHDA